MNILILATMTPLCGFYLYALVNFQRELRRSKRNETPDAKTIPLYWRDGQLSGADPTTTSVDVELPSLAGRETRIVEAPVSSQRQGKSPTVQGASQEVYQVESVYLGPFLLIPMKNSKSRGTQQYVTPVTSKHA